MVQQATSFQPLQPFERLKFIVRRQAANWNVGAWALITKIPINRSAQVVRLLDSRCFDLRKTANDLLRSIWENLIAVDYDNREITINKELDGSYCLNE